ncbi:uncharacterized protein LOC121400939 [Xenopus laevis]|uniref:Uncharacterized protein LOC121400939 n=2 Tax=Xenopus laevis TaxID=8355 RepID=A0A1L8I292_XENLA|nr:uncharacterized protein LOC121400939 [Xenopus laevis]OCU02445.1 hypothetical protein XELAEV_18008209mg [Xenopus laevis]
MNLSKKKVTFSKAPVVLGSAGKHVHSGILQHYHQIFVKHLSLTSHLYRKLKEHGILTTEQIGLLELEESPDKRISKLLEILKSASNHTFTMFCAILHETGQHHLAQTLQKATHDNGSVLPNISLVLQPKQVLNETLSWHHGYDRAIKVENIQKRRKMQGMRSKYLANLQELEERISLAKWERDIAIRERNIIWNENQALQNLNTELQSLIVKLRETTLHSKTKNLRITADYIDRRANKLQPLTHLNLT